jgi:hypothetical protein
MEIITIILGIISMIIVALWLYSGYLQDKKNEEFINRLNNFDNENNTKTKSN